MFNPGDIIDGKFRVEGVCSEAGGMGAVLHVSPLAAAPECRIVLKYCRDSDEEQLRRFRREVRLLGSFKGNSKVVQIVDHNLDHDPPYFVMKYYPDGDLFNRAATLRNSYAAQEECFLQMIDCIQELHSRNEYHRDIKPQNFLLEGSRVVVSDFGLTTEIGSKTAFTRSSKWWGTQGYIPPDFMEGGFKNADAAGDIFMLGKTMYVLLTEKEPLYLFADRVPAPLFHVIQRCCNISKTQRYQTLAELKQYLVAAFDVLLERGGGLGKARQTLSVINDRVIREGSYKPDEVADFLEQLGLLDDTDQVRICEELSSGFFSVMGQEQQIDRISDFLAIYEKMVEAQGYSWGFAETIASNMSVLFSSKSVRPSEKAYALDLAIRAATYMNRFAAMDTCRSMVTSVRDEELGFQVASILLKNRESFISGVERSECHSEAIRSALAQIIAQPQSKPWTQEEAN